MLLRTGDSGLDERRDRQAHHPPRFVDRTRTVPATHREDASVGQLAAERLPRFHGVETILGQREGARARRRPGVDHAHLDRVEGLVSAGEPATGLVYDQPHTGQ